MYEQLRECYSDTQIEKRSSLSISIGNFLPKNTTEDLTDFAQGDCPQVPQIQNAPPNVSHTFKHLKIKEEMRIDLKQQFSSPPCSTDSNFRKLYPIEEVSENSNYMQLLIDEKKHDDIRKILEENLLQSINRPNNSKRKAKQRQILSLLDEVIEIHKASYASSKQSVVASAFAETPFDSFDLQNEMEEMTKSTENLLAYKRDVINRLNSDSRFLKRRTKLSENVSSSKVSSLKSDNDFSSFQTNSNTTICKSNGTTSCLDLFRYCMKTKKSK